jgi:8-oxo-dGTP pyrophosphatase MutT (NUDIX family)
MSSDDFEVVESRILFKGRIVSVRQDSIRMPDGSVAPREIVDHLGAVVVVALDDEDRVVMVNQYRPAVGARLDELPAGLLDVADEAPLDAARRELAEEALLAAGRWEVLLDLHSSPGFSDEAVRVFLARDLSATHRPDGFAVEHEEASMTVTKVPLETAVERVFAGEITNAAAVAGVLAAHVARTSQRELRAEDAPWPSRRAK